MCTRQSESIEYSVPFGSEDRWFLARITAIPAYHGQPKTVCMTARDITERKRAEEELRNAKGVGRGGEPGEEPVPRQHEPRNIARR